MAANKKIGIGLSQYNDHNALNNFPSQNSWEDFNEEKKIALEENKIAKKGTICSNNFDAFEPQKVDPSKKKKLTNKENKKTNGLIKKKSKSRFKFLNIFAWGCRGKSKVSNPKSINKNQKLEIRNNYKREIRSDQNWNSIKDNSILFDDSNLKTVYFKDKNSNSGSVTENKKGNWPVKRTIDSKKSQEVSPDSDDLSDISESDSKNSDERSSTDDEHTHEETHEVNNNAFSDDSEHEREDSNPSFSSESEESEIDENEDKISSWSENERRKEISQRNCGNSHFQFLKGEEEKRLDNFSSEYDEISGTARPPSLRVIVPASSIMNDPSENNEIGQESMIFSLKVNEGNQVGKPRPSTTYENEKLWRVEDDEILRNITEKQNKNGVINWEKVSRDLARFQRIAHQAITSKECKRRYHQINRKKADLDWTDREIKTLISLHKKYGNSWKRISKKIQTKNDKQCKYKYESMLNRQKTSEEQKQEVLRNYNRWIYDANDYPIAEEDEESKNSGFERMGSGEQYKQMLYKNSQSGSIDGIKISEYEYRGFPLLNQN